MVVGPWEKIRMSDERERKELEKDIAELKDEIAFGIHAHSGISYRKGETHFYRSKLRALQKQLDKLIADERPVLILKAQREIKICDRELQSRGRDKRKYWTSRRSRARKILRDLDAREPYKPPLDMNVILAVEHES
jgi:hypothetical protein